MVSSISSNIPAYAAQANIAIASNKAATSISRLSSGNRIVHASDDVSGLAIGTALRTQVTTLQTALSNASQGTSLLQVADGALGQIVDILQRQKAIATQASSGQLTDANRALLDQEFQALTAQVDQIANSTNFNGVNLLGGGLGSSTSLARTDTLASNAIVTTGSIQTGTGPTTVVASTTAIQAFYNNNSTGSGTTAPGASKTTLTGTAGGLVVTDSSGTTLANAQYLTVDGSVYGQFSDFQFSNVTYGANASGTATLTATINGVEYTGNVVGGAANVTAVLSHGSTYLKLGLGAVDFSNNSTTDFTRASITAGFSTTSIALTSAVQGIDFTGTALAGVTGSSTRGVADVRTTTSGNVDIGNFAYVSNTGVANNNTLSVQVNGVTYTATGVNDSITAGGTITFSAPGRVDALTIDFTGLTTTINNIRTSQVDRDNFINALNLGFGKAGSGLDFAIGSTASDNIRVSFDSASSTSLYNGATLSVATQASAQTASDALDAAITTATSIRATVGALQSRFNYASNSIQAAVENQDAARSQYLDTDVSAESTAYASAQVQLQAGITVLAQANLLQQNLLKLLGN